MSFCSFSGMTAAAAAVHTRLFLCTDCTADDMLRPWNVTECLTSKFIVHLLIPNFFEIRLVVVKKNRNTRDVNFPLRVLPMYFLPRKYRRLGLIPRKMFVFRGKCCVLAWRWNCVWCGHSTSCQSDVATLLHVWCGHSTLCQSDVATPCQSDVATALHISLVWPLHFMSVWCGHYNSCQSDLATPPHVGLTWPPHLMSDVATPLHVSLAWPLHFISAWLWPLHVSMAVATPLDLGLAVATPCQSGVATPLHVSLTVATPLHVSLAVATPLHVSLDCHIFHHQTSFFGSRVRSEISAEQLKSFALIKRATVFVVACGGASQISLIAVRFARRC